MPTLVLNQPFAASPVAKLRLRRFNINCQGDDVTSHTTLFVFEKLDANGVVLGLETKQVPLIDVAPVLEGPGTIDEKFAQMMAGLGLAGSIEAAKPAPAPAPKKFTAKKKIA